jgi:kelch-like protein 20
MKKLIIISICLTAMSLQTGIAQWTTTRMSQNKMWMGSATLGTKVYFAGGYGVNATGVNTSRAEIYDIATGKWTYTFLSVARDNLAGIAAGSKVFFAGGADATQMFATVDILDTLTGKWSVANLSIPRIFISPVVVGSKVLFAGGGHQSQFEKSVSRVDIYDLDSEQWSTAELSKPGFALAAASIGDIALFAGGLNFDSETGLTEVRDIVDIYNAATGLWSTTRLSQPRFFLAGAAAGNKFLLAGGLDSVGNPSNVVDIYDLGSDTWSTDTLVAARGFQGNNQNAATACGKVFFVGGVQQLPYFEYQDDWNVIDIYDPATNSWDVDFLPVSLFGHSVVSADNKLFVAGGATLVSQGWDIHNEVHIYDCKLSSWIEIANPAAGQVSIAPNPASLQFTIDITPDVPLSDASMQVFDQVGRHLMSKSGDALAGQHDISQWDAGIYFVSIRGRDFNLTTKLVKME